MRITPQVSTRDSNDNFWWMTSTRGPCFRRTCPYSRVNSVLASLFLEHDSLIELQDACLTGLRNPMSRFLGLILSLYSRHSLLNNSITPHNASKWYLITAAWLRLAPSLKRCNAIADSGAPLGVSNLDT